jgi:hypothetical protein
MKFPNAIKIHRKSGVRLGERGAPVRFPSTAINSDGAQLSDGPFIPIQTYQKRNRRPVSPGLTYSRVIHC